MRLRHLMCVFVLLLCGCAPSLVEERPHPVVNDKGVVSNVDNAVDYHHTMAILADVYNSSKGVIPKSETFYNVVGKLIEEHKTCPFNETNYQFIKVALAEAVKPSFDDGQRWNRSRAWAEIWKMSICQQDVVKSITLSFSPAEGTSWKIN